MSENRCFVKKFDKHKHC